ncbi:hypothetical protein Q8W71_21545 [Methylobacterium sp. NEAU 140]|uniref:hypothetical protein n=1 Tax=Methylobacterium sp. NEAU 140 TaxID=3064945 RepID=UPI002736FFB0|nr:hypothetical protein [Methylobacterium sp. NEAU 140]MDP4025218.1 hypothetical protein [Methylobacterium sp. NEAU 140]
MSDTMARGPRNPSRVIFVVTAVVSVATGLITGDISTFILTVIGSALLLCGTYAVIRRWLGWKPLSFDYLSEMIRLLPG